MKGFMRAAALLLGAAVAACASRPPLANEPLVWEPTVAPAYGTIDFSTLGQTRIQFGRFSDARHEPQRIGENRDQDPPLPVTTSGDVAGFVGGHMHELLARSGLNIVEGNAGVVLSGEVRQFFVVERKQAYRGEVVVHLNLRNGAGKLLWEGDANAYSDIDGKTYALDNYCQALSDAVTEATTALLQDPDFRWALARR
jgi:hypothetical protein